MAEQIYREIYLFSRRRVQPIDIVAGSQIPIALKLMDYTVPPGAAAAVFSRRWSSTTVYTQAAQVQDNTVVFTPEDGFFAQGGNSLQLEINGSKIPLLIDVSCGARLSDGGEGATPEAVRPLVARAEEAAKNAEESKLLAQDSADKAAESLQEAIKNASAASTSAAGAAKSLTDANAAKTDAEAAAEQAKQFADTAAGYAGAATVSIGWDADGYFSIFVDEEE